MKTSLTPLFTAAIRTGALLATVVGAHAVPVLIDFSNATPEPGVADGNGNRWTTVGTVGTNGTAANTSANNLIDATGAATAIDIDLVFTGGTVVGIGGNGINGRTGPAPLDQSFAVIDGIYSNKDFGVATVTFSDLAPNTPYDLSMIGGRASNGFDGLITVITGTGDGGLILNDGTVLDLTIVSDESGEIAFTFADADPISNDAAASLNAMSITQVPVSGFALTITPATAPATGFDLEGESQEGKLYNLRTSTDLVGGVTTWDLVEGGGDIAATAPMNLFSVAPADTMRFYAVEEFDAPPPPPIFATTFEEDDGGFTVSTTEGTGWAHGNPDSSGPGGLVTTGNDSSTNCWGTNLGNHAGGSGDPGFYSNPTDTSLRSPVIDLTDVAAATLTFAQALDLDTGDSAIVNIIDDTTDTVIAADIVSILDDDTINANWETIGPVAIPAAALGRAVRIEWRLTGTGGFSADFMGWYIDDVVVAPTTP